MMAFLFHMSAASEGKRTRMVLHVAKEIESGDGTEYLEEYLPLVRYKYAELSLNV
ncbi:hypothetical protein BBR47_13050 [Brevibacillus brevis NBRC 100599]|uniref:Uncharacterized protein n=1 Tax=Brevibacillus brevis (strain 47 / JCM 6285 / NBRC 100599) TaxID=358681 RepID=C0Z7N9_BREBN|nr:hypothetical protein BBR47_13050 [Brevibacillus brevis NBRC 100599]